MKVKNQFLNLVKHYIKNKEKNKMETPKNFKEYFAFAEVESSSNINFDNEIIEYIVFRALKNFTSETDMKTYRVNEVLINKSHLTNSKIEIELEYYIINDEDDYESENVSCFYNLEKLNSKIAKNYLNELDETYDDFYINYNLANERMEIL
tara:strand:+ start:5908 stop:6360 length:453 start_codon:yes stop_codon:yes gene_type:complete